MKNKLYQSSVKNIVKAWLVPMSIAVFLFAVIKPIGAQADDEKHRLSDYLVLNNIEVGMETVNDRSHIYYVFEGNKKFITGDSYNNRQPKTKGEFVVYVKEINGEGQIFLYHVPTTKTIQITRTGPNLNPDVSRQGKVSWEGWVYGNGVVPDSWQAFVFDGTTVRQITQGETSVNTSINGEHVLYSTRDNTGEWRSEVYSIAQNKSKVVAFGFKNKTVRLVGDEITYDEGGVFPLRPADFFLLDIPNMDSLSPNELSAGSTPTPVPSLTPSL